MAEKLIKEVYGGDGKTMALELKTYRLGFDKPKGAFRIAAVRYLPRGVKKTDYKKYFDVWFPLIAPSAALVKSYMKGKDWKSFRSGYEREIEKSPSERASLRLLTEVAKRTPVAIGCYCEEESLCHRSILKKLIEGEG